MVFRFKTAMWVPWVIPSAHNQRSKRASVRFQLMWQICPHMCHHTLDNQKLDAKEVHLQGR